MWPSLIYLPLLIAGILETKLYVNPFVVVVVSSLQNIVYLPGFALYISESCRKYSSVTCFFSSTLFFFRFIHVDV